MGAVEDVEDGSYDGDDEDEKDEEEGEPEAAGAAAASAVAAAVVGLRAVGRACGAVELGLGSREGAVVGAGTGGAVGVGLSSGIDPVCHGFLRFFWSLENKEKGVCFGSERANKG